MTSVEEALGKLDGVDVLVLANPPYNRESQIRSAVERGIPMLIEKPLALDMHEAGHLVSIAESAGVSMMIGLNFRYLPVTIELVRLLEDGVVGTPEFARFTYERWRDGWRANLNKYPLTMEHPMLWEQSIHHFDLLRYVYGQEPVSVQCHTWNPAWSMYDSDTNVSAIFQFVGGLSVNYQGTWMSSWSVPGFEWRTECSEGIIKQDEQFSDLSYARRADEALIPVDLPHHEIWVSETIGLWEAFLDHVLDGEALACSGRDHLMSLAMVEACVVSSRTGETVQIADVLAEPQG